MPELTRRQFLKATGASALGALLLGACTFKPIELLMESPHDMPEDLVTGREAWYATLCRECPAGCGTVVRVVEGRAVKVEGNPLHPINRGKLCARGQAAVQALYHPDRLLTPLVRAEKGGPLQEAGWTEAMEEALLRLAQLKAAGQADRVYLIAEPLRGSQALVARRFMEAYGGRLLAYEPLEDTALRAALRRTFGGEALPDPDIASAQFILSFGADLLSTWLSPVRYSRGYGEFRQGDRPRGTLVQVEPRFSLTAANADLWLPIKPGAEGHLALSLAQVIVEEGLGDAGAARALYKDVDLEKFRPEAAQDVTGVPAERIRSLARDFATRRPSLALAGGSAAAHTNGMPALAAVYALNYLVGSPGQPGGLRFNPEPDPSRSLRATPFREWQRLVEEWASHPPSLLLVHRANPAYGLPASLDFSRALGQVPYIISFSSFMDEAAAQADLILPLTAPLEEWGDDIPDPGPGHRVLSLQQPVVLPQEGPRPFADLLLELGRPLALGLPWPSLKEALREHVRELPGAPPAGGFEEFWMGLLSRGGWWEEGARGAALPGKGAAPAGPPPALALAPPPTFAGEEEAYPYYLIPFPSHTLLDGRGAHLPWLQATPDPLTTVAWQTWVEINAATAREMGIVLGDILALESPHGRMEAPAYPHPMMPPGAVAVPLGQGHLNYTRYAQGRGANPFSLLAPLAEGETGALAWAATRVRVSKTGRRARVPRFQGPVEAYQLPDNEIVRVVPPERRRAG